MTSIYRFIVIMLNAVRLHMLVSVGSQHFFSLHLLLHALAESFLLLLLLLVLYLLMMLNLLMLLQMLMLLNLLMLMLDLMMMLLLHLLMLDHSLELLNPFLLNLHHFLPFLHLQKLLVFHLL